MRGKEREGEGRRGKEREGEGRRGMEREGWQAIYCYKSITAGIHSTHSFKEDYPSAVADF